MPNKIEAREKHLDYIYHLTYDTLFIARDVTEHLELKDAICITLEDKQGKNDKQ